MQQPDLHAVTLAQTKGRKERNRGKRVEPEDRHPARTGHRCRVQATATSRVSWRHCADAIGAHKSFISLVL